jgi:hypothetical protein
MRLLFFKECLFVTKINQNSLIILACPIDRKIVREFLALSDFFFWQFYQNQCIETASSLLSVENNQFLQVLREFLREFLAEGEKKTSGVFWTSPPVLPPLAGKQSPEVFSVRGAFYDNFSQKTP